LVACAPDSEAAVLAEFRRDGFQPAVIGRLSSATPGAARLMVS